MPKKQSKNPYYFYMQYYFDKKKREGNAIPWASVANAASPSWQDMPDNEKERFREMSKQAKAGGSVNPVFANNTNRPKLNENKPKPQRDIMTSQGILYSEIERRRNAAEEFEKEMKDKISTLIDDGFLNNCIREQPFYFIHGTYFCKNALSHLYTPAEVGLTRFSLQNGIEKKFHSMINPGSMPLGYLNDAKEHSIDTHGLPIMEDTIKGEIDFYKIGNNIINFIKPKNGFYKHNENKLVVFTPPSDFPIINSFLEQFYDKELVNVSVLVFSLEELFFQLKRKSEEMSIHGNITIDNIFKANILLSNDPYQADSHLACSFHNDIDVGQYCSLSNVVRWCYTFANFICPELEIDPLPGKHKPRPITDLDNFVDSEDEEENDSENDFKEEKKEVKHSTVRIVEKVEDNDELELGEAPPPPEWPKAQKCQYEASNKDNSDSNDSYKFNDRDEKVIIRSRKRGERSHTYQDFDDDSDSDDSDLQPNQCESKRSRYSIKCEKSQR